ncbi:unnamed protein product [Brassica napus]|uniref:(rape) hypothetical protein n=1 Tax=Brassica napus TaxID=3708 RepID=A0A816TA64_BRANA|nr:unnamed protein product [Brassica napus]
MTQRERVVKSHECPRGTNGQRVHVPNGVFRDSVLSPRTNLLICVLMDSHGRPVSSGYHQTPARKVSRKMQLNSLLSPTRR